MATPELVDPYRDAGSLQEQIDALKLRVETLEARLENQRQDPDPEGTEDQDAPRKVWRKKSFFKRSLAYVGREQCERCEHYHWKYWKSGAELGDEEEGWKPRVAYSRCLLRKRNWEASDGHCDQFYPAKRFWRPESELGPETEELKFGPETEALKPVPLPDLNGLTPDVQKEALPQWAKVNHTKGNGVQW